MQVLPVRRLDFDPGANIRSDKGVVEYRDAGQRCRPSPILEYGRCAIDSEDDMRRVLSAEALPFVDQARLSRIERTKDGRDSRFAAPVFGIDERKLRQRNLSTCIHRIELAYVPQKRYPLKCHGRRLPELPFLEFCKMCRS
jgi:hypothetical protein